MRRLIAWVLAALAGPALAQEQVWIPMNAGGQALKLEATLYRPDGAGPFPLVIYSHTAGAKTPARQTVRPTLLAQLLVGQGIAVLAPMRRGRGASEGSPAEPFDCNPGAHAGGVDNAVQDTDAAVAYARTLPFVDASRVVLAGSSRGGLLSLVYAARRPDVAVGVVSFVGAWTSQSCSRGFHESALAEAGRAARAPSLWLYAENDSYFSTDDVRRYAAAYEKAGGRLQLRLYPYSGGDGHLFWFRAPELYRDDLLAFLKGLGLAR